MLYHDLLVILALSVQCTNGMKRKFIFSFFVKCNVFISEIKVKYHKKCWIEFDSNIYIYLSNMKLSCYLASNIG